MVLAYVSVWHAAWSDGVDRAPTRMIQGGEEAGANAAAESGRVPSRLLALMANFRTEIGVQLSKDVEEGSHPRSTEESFKSMQAIIEILLDQNEQLVCCLAELENEAEKRTLQMQRRLHSTADVTRETVYNISEWGEEIQSIISKRHLAEKTLAVSERTVAELQKENNQLRSYNDNLFSDIQSLLSIINEARTTGNWEMDCVTFCVISPEEVYGPICRLSSQHPDGVAVLDLKPGRPLQSPETEAIICPSFSKSADPPAKSVHTDVEMALTECNGGVLDTQDPCSSAGLYENFREATGAANSAPSKVGGKSKSCRTKFSTNMPEVCREAEVSLSKSLPVLCVTMKDNMKDCGSSRLRRKLLIQKRSRSFKSVLFSSWKRSTRNMRKRLTLSTSKQRLSAPVHNSHFGHNVATVATTASRNRLYHCPAEYKDIIQNEASDTSSEVVRKQTDQWSSGGHHKETRCMSAVQEGPLKTDKKCPTIMTTTKHVAEWEWQSNKSESLPTLSSVWEESMVIQGNPMSLESFLLSPWKTKTRNVRRRLVFSTPKKPSAPKMTEDSMHLVATKGNKKDATTETYAEVSIQTDVLDQTFGHDSTQTNLSSTFRKNDQREGSLPLHHALVQTDDDKKSTVIMGTQTDIECERQSNKSESLPTLSSVWEESMVIQGNPMSLESFLLSPWKTKTRNVRRRLVFSTPKKPSAPKMTEDSMHLEATKGNKKDATTETYAEVSVQTDVLDQTFGHDSTQTNLSSTFRKNDRREGSLPLHHALVQTDDDKKSTVIMGTQTDVECEKCLPSGNEQRDQELSSLKDRLNLAVQEAQSKTLLAMELQGHLDVSAKELENMRLTVQYLQDALTDLKKKASSTTAVPRVFDV
ncbi:uncharacterized protein LOC142564100 isoform X2 [Dermacentor variabilis]|uniref:uncharacterized protein LOC142564100 isoform X2 n=1 Tax=Dermacentor variabilis TaxID=34621 RepID=UPI003F5C7680